MNENESLTVTLTLENDEELECAVLTIFETDGREYIALLPLDENGDNDDGQVYLYRFIDNGVLSGQTTLYLIHGKGTGALRKAIHEHLRRHPSVKSFRLGNYGEGEAGVTVVELK